MSQNVAKCRIYIVFRLCYSIIVQEYKSTRVHSETPSFFKSHDSSWLFLFAVKQYKVGENMIYKNRQHLHEIVQGRYGRKISYTDVDRITESNILGILADCIGDFNYNRRVIGYLWNYYKGDQPALYRVKKKAMRDDICNNVVENHAYEFVQFKVAQTYGEPVQAVSRSKDEHVGEAVDEYNNFMVDADKQSKDIKSGEWQSATGTSFKAVQRTGDADIPFRIVAPSPLNTFMIYSRSTEEAMLVVQELKDVDNQQYYLCFSDTHEFRVKNGQVILARLHAFGGIPIVEYPNNHERISDIELVITLLDAINEYQSNRVDSVEAFVSSWVKFVNCDIDEETFAKMKTMGALAVKSNNGENKADVDVITQELNQTETQVAKDDLLENALSILAIPNKNGNGGDRQGAVELRNGWDFSKARAKMKDPIVKASEKKLARVVLNILRQSGHDLGITIRDFDIQINHSPLDNMIIKCQALQYLLQCGIHPQIAIAKVGLFEDAEKTYIMSLPYIKHLWKTIDDEEKQEQEQKADELLAKMGGGLNETTKE